MLACAYPDTPWRTPIVSRENDVDPTAFAARPSIRIFVVSVIPDAGFSSTLPSTFTVFRAGTDTIAAGF